MKKQLLSIGMLAAIFTVGSVLVSGQTPREKGNSPQKLLRHVVLFKFKDGVTEAQIREVTDAFAALPKRIDTIKGFEWGTDVSVEKKADGFTHCFVVTFQAAADRDAYIPHAAHQEFVKLVGPRLEKVLVVDYWAQ
jgi:hypothetical protein